jgi:hypothetical protein
MRSDANPFPYYLLPRPSQIHSNQGGQATSMITARRDVMRPVRKNTAVAVHRLLRVGYIPWKNIANDERTNAMVPKRMAIL